LTDLQSARVLLIGTGRHRADSGLPTVPAVAPTLKALRQALVDRCGVDPGNIRVLQDPADPMALGDAVATVTEQATDVLLVYFVGHGLVGTDGTLHLATRSTDFRPNRIPHTALPFRTVRECIRDSPAQSKIVILDCCWGGLAIETLGGGAGQLAELSRIEGTFVLTAAGSYEKALAPRNERYTTFSGELLRWLADGDPEGAAELTLDATYQGIWRRLVGRGGPEPQRRATGRAGDLVVMLNPAYVPGPRPQSAAAPKPGRRRWSVRRRLFTGLAALTILGPLAGYGVDRTLASSCEGSVRISVGVAPEILDLVNIAAQDWISEASTSPGPCMSVQTTAVDPATTAVGLAAGAGRTLTGLDQPGGQSPVLDAWIPDSSLWLERVRAVNRRLVPDDAPPIADSPIVLAATASAGWSTIQPTWSEIGTQLTTNIRVRIGLVDPVVDASGLAMMLAVVPKPAAPATPLTIGTVKALSESHTELRDEMLNRLGRSSSAAAAAMPEYAVAAYNAQNPRSPLTLVRPTPVSPTSLDYPYAILPTTKGEKATAAARFREWLVGDEFLKRLKGSAFQAPSRAAAPATAGIDNLLTFWLAAVRPVRALLVADVSAASGTSVPNAGGMSRLKMTSTALTAAVSMLDDDCLAGVWSYGSGRKYRSLVPLTPLSAGRLDIQTAVEGLTTDGNGKSSLYDTIVAGYQTALEDWEPGMRNLVLVLAAGVDPGSATAMIQKLARLTDPHRPVEVALVFVGSATPKPLRGAAGIRLYPTPDGAKVGDSVLRALTGTIAD
jgi:hypothetical protein